MCFHTAEAGPIWRDDRDFVRARRRFDDAACGEVEPVQIATVECVGRPSEIGNSVQQ